MEPPRIVGQELSDQGVKVVDLGSDFRFDTAARYEEAYGSPHPLPAQLGQWRYGLPELFDLHGRRPGGLARVVIPPPPCWRSPLF